MKKLLRDPRLGLPAYAFITPDHNTHLAIYRDHRAHRWVYDLFEKDGMLLPNGGVNLFLSASAMGGPFTMNHPIIRWPRRNYLPALCFWKQWHSYYREYCTAGRLYAAVSFPTWIIAAFALRS